MLALKAPPQGGAALLIFYSGLIRVMMTSDVDTPQRHKNGVLGGPR